MASLVILRRRGLAQKSTDMTTPKDWAMLAGLPTMMVTARVVVVARVFHCRGPQTRLVAVPAAGHKFLVEGSAWYPGQLCRARQKYFAGRDPERNFSAVNLMER